MNEFPKKPSTSTLRIVEQTTNTRDTSQTTEPEMSATGFVDSRISEVLSPVVESFYKQQDNLLDILKTLSLYVDDLSRKPLANSTNMSNNQVMTDTYSKTETDLMIKNLDQKFEHSLDKMISSIKDIVLQSQQQQQQSLNNLNQTILDVRTDLAGVKTDLSVQQTQLKTEFDWIKNQRAWLWYPVAVGFLLIAGTYLLQTVTDKKEQSTIIVNPDPSQVHKHR